MYKQFVKKNENILIFSVICFLLLFFKFRKKETKESPNDIVLRSFEDEKKKDSSFSSLSETEITMIADKLDGYLLRSVTENEWGVISQIKKCKTSKDWTRLVLKFGERKPIGFFRDALTLPAALMEYLQDSEYRAVVTYVKSIGGVL